MGRQPGEQEPAMRDDRDGRGFLQATEKKPKNDFYDLSDLFNKIQFSRYNENPFLGELKNPKEFYSKKNLEEILNSYKSKHSLEESKNTSKVAKKGIPSTDPQFPWIQDPMLGIQFRDPAEVFRQNLKRALSDEDLGTSDTDPRLTPYIPNETGQITAGTARSMGEAQLRERIIKLREQVDELDDKLEPDKAAILKLNSVLMILVDEAERRDIDTASLVPKAPEDTLDPKPPSNKKPSSLSDFFRPVKNETPKPSTGLEDLATEELERRRTNLEKSGLDAQTIKFLTKSIDQELESRK